jgi:hypothetical protein
MNKEFTDLVKEYLTDGFISPKEREVLLKKAVKLGIDVDEADLYIDAQQQKENIKIDQAIKKRKGRECPFCGGIINDLVDKCPHRGCGKTITPQASEELEQILEALEKALVDFKSDKKQGAKNKAMVERYSRKARLYYEHNPKVHSLLEQIDEEVKRTEEAKQLKEKAAEEAKRLKKKAAEEAERKKKRSTIIIVIVSLLFPLGLIVWALSYVSSEDSYKEPSKEKSVIEQVQMYINDDEISLAESTLSDAMMMEENAYRIFSKYDAICYKIIKYHLDEDDLSAAEDFALEYRAILMDDDKWEDSSCYKLLEKKFKEEDRSFENLKVGWF